MKLEGVTEETADYPGGGHFQRDGSGRMTGVCEESLVNTFGAFVPKPGPEEMSKILGDTLVEHFAKKGLTTIVEAWVPGVEQSVQALGLFELLEAKGNLGVRVGFHPNTLQQPRPAEFAKILKAKGYTQSALGAPMFTASADSNGHLLSVSGVKMLSDASGQGKTAFVSEAYLGDTTTNFGGLNFTKEEIWDRLKEIKDAGFSPMVHAIGDRAQDVVLDGFEKYWGAKADYEKEGAWRLRLEHVTVSREDEYPRMAKMGVYPSFMSSFYYWMGTFCYRYEWP